MTGILAFLAKHIFLLIDIVVLTLGIVVIYFYADLLSSEDESTELGYGGRKIADSQIDHDYGNSEEAWTRYWSKTMVEKDNLLNTTIEKV